MLEKAVIELEGQQLEIPKDEKTRDKLTLKLKKQMYDAASKREFEKAALLRDNLKRVTEYGLLASPKEGAS